ncbi:Ig-like domain-containing protein, partial [Acinetobacter stercoris]|uniref:Ig-like domain-containing protein n=1 Tax=Acinetobacter stercoris TaxID=2126983 RepID=UPI001D18458C
ADGTTITTTTDTAGNWSITPNPLGDGEVGKVTATDAAGNNSAPTMTDGTDITPPAAPGVDQNNGTELSGTAEAGSIVTVTDADGNTVTTTADSTGHWSITPNPIADGSEGSVTATDAAGNTSAETPTGTADTVAPTAPGIDQNNESGLSGTAEPESTISVELADGTTITTTTDTAGNWSITPNPLGDGEVGKVTATDAAGNNSAPTMTDGTDITPPAAP